MIMLNTVNRALIKFGFRKPPFVGSIGRFAMTSEEEAITLASAKSDLEETIVRHRGRTVHKWTHYLPIYDRVLSAYRTKSNLTLLEIGISMGGSLEVWRDYFGAEATIAGIDIDERCRDRVDAPNKAFIGSQAEPSFLRNVVDQIGTPDIIIDDGSHVAAHQRTSFDTLFPLLDKNGVYVIEDVHTSYWGPVFGGGYRQPRSILEYCKTVIDDMHGNHHDQPFREDLSKTVESITFYDSVIVIKKGEVLPLRHVHLPSGAKPAVDPII